MAAHLEEGSEADQEPLVTLHDHCPLWLLWEGKKKEKKRPIRRTKCPGLCVFFFLCFVVAALLLLFFFRIDFWDWTVTPPDPMPARFMEI